MEPLLDPKSIRRLADLELLARQVVEGAITGLHRSPFHGFSVDFLEHRPYAPGDDLRRLDWKVFGKTDRHYVRQYEDETNLRATVVIDASASMGYASDEVSKLEYAVRLGAALIYLLIHQQDAVGLAILDGGLRKSIPPRDGPRQLALLLEELEALRPGAAPPAEESAPPLAPLLDQLAPRLPRRGLVLVLSDFLDDPDLVVEALARLRAERQELVAFQILDREEIEFRFRGWTRFEALEGAGRSVVVDPAQVRAGYLERLRVLQQALRDGCTRHRADFVAVATDTPYDEALLQYLLQRESRR
jgi:uncharacterized protein (DUF58 family)